MKEIEPWKAVLFVGILALLAVALNLSQANNRTPRKPSKAEVKAAEEQAASDAAAEHKRYLARYLNEGFLPKSGCKAVAVAVKMPSGVSPAVITSALGRKLESATRQTVPSLFTPEFLSGELFRNTFAGSRAIFTDLELSNRIDMICLAQATVEYSTNRSLENIISAHANLEIVAVPFSPRDTDMSWSFDATGPGFTKAEAWKLAQERLVQAISDATNMTINP